MYDWRRERINTFAENSHARVEPYLTAFSDDSAPLRRTDATAVCTGRHCGERIVHFREQNVDPGRSGSHRRLPANSPQRLVQRAFRQSVSDCCTDLIAKRLRVEGFEHVVTVKFFEISKIDYDTDSREA